MGFHLALPAPFLAPLLLQAHGPERTRDEQPRGEKDDQPGSQQPAPLVREREVVAPEPVNDHEAGQLRGLHPGRNQRCMAPRRKVHGPGVHAPEGGSRGRDVPGRR